MNPATGGMFDLLDCGHWALARRRIGRRLLVRPGYSLRARIHTRPRRRARSVQEQMRVADAAFVGRLIDVRPRRTLGEVNFRYRIGKAYKGKRRLRRGQIVTVRSARSTASCGLPDDVGGHYGLLLDRREGRPRWRSGLCSLMSARDAPGAQKHCLEGALRSARPAAR